MKQSSAGFSVLLQALWHARRVDRMIERVSKAIAPLRRRPEGTGTGFGIVEMIIALQKGVGGFESVAVQCARSRVDLPGLPAADGG